MSFLRPGVNKQHNLNSDLDITCFQNGHTPLMLALRHGHVATAELLINHGMTGGWAGASTGRWLAMMDKHRLSALCWAVLKHPMSAAPYIAIRMAEAHSLQKFLRVSHSQKIQFVVPIGPNQSHHSHIVRCTVVTST